MPLIPSIQSVTMKVLPDGSIVQVIRRQSVPVTIFERWLDLNRIGLRNGLLGNWFLPFGRKKKRRSGVGITGEMEEVAILFARSGQENWNHSPDRFHRISAATDGTADILSSPR